MRSCILCHTGGWRERKRCGPSGWVPVWVTLYPGGLDDGVQGGEGRRETPPCLACRYIDTQKKSRRDFTSEVAVMLPCLYARVGLRAN